MNKDWEKTISSIKYKKQMPNVFYPYISLNWNVGKENESVSLYMDYQLFKYLKSLLWGRSFCCSDPERNIYYSNFVETLVQLSQSNEDIRILSSGHSARLKMDGTLLEMNNDYV